MMEMASLATTAKTTIATTLTTSTTTTTTTTTIVEKINTAILVVSTSREGENRQAEDFNATD